MTLRPGYGLGRPAVAPEAGVGVALLRLVLVLLAAVAGALFARGFHRAAAACAVSG